MTPSSDSKHIGTDELLKDTWFLTQGLAQAPSSSLLQFHFFPAVGMKLLTKMVFSKFNKHDFESNQILSSSLATA